MSEKNSWIHGAFEWGRRMQVKVIAADNCAFLALNGDSYIFYKIEGFCVRKVIESQIISVRSKNNLTLSQ